MTFVHITRRVLCVLAFIGLTQTAIAQDAPRVKFVTNAGEFVVEVYPDKAPKTVDNFCNTCATSTTTAPSFTA